MAGRLLAAEALREPISLAVPAPSDYHRAIAAHRGSFEFDIKGDQPWRTIGSRGTLLTHPEVDCIAVADVDVKHAAVCTESDLPGS